ncbi:zinc finger protein ZAT3-like [Phragmites australis]|uniref:zinc finger protein ZAT3-like n=1 Tax=Phragmites australis TaxID=29695 RepID=UPI002D774965|nr:zinc finger protein ZAT3-like [Phragmites australis]
MEHSSPPPALQPAVPPPPPELPPPHHDTMLTLALKPPPPPLACALSPRPPHLWRPRPDGGATAAALARVRSSPTGDTPPCTECGKRFPSWKALFGHMRCHPERQWRGITPPPHFRLGAVGAPGAAAEAGHKFTVQEREVAASLLMLAGARPGAGKGKKRIISWPSWNESCGASTSSVVAPAPAKCDDHKCSVCARGFATGQALGGHKRCHWERACAGVLVVATSSSCSTLATSETAATSTATALDLNLPPPEPLLTAKKDQGGSMNAMLDLKLGY